MAKKKQVLLSQFLETLECSASETNNRLLLQQKHGESANLLFIKQMKVSFSANVSKPDSKSTEDLLLDFGKSEKHFFCDVTIAPLASTCAATQKTIHEGEK